MTVKQSKVTAGTDPVSLFGGIADLDGTYAGIARSMVLSNEGVVSVYIGGYDVTSTSYGYKLAAGGTLALDLAPGDEPYAITASSTSDVRVLHLGV